MDPEASDCFSTQHHDQFVLTSGASAHKWQCDSPRAILILQHGFGEYAERYVVSHSQLIPKLNTARFEVWALDLWGHGTSPGDRGIVDVEMAVKDHLEMRRRADARGLPVFLFGHSLGGLITAASVAEKLFIPHKRSYPLEPGSDRGIAVACRISGSPTGLFYAHYTNSHTKGFCGRLMWRP
ncbi:hypothetical protein CEP52_005406 [Fusarium oligoseptatum]|uniref:Serine aminopeptidase S33 domain-containing protein n=1 Tax=Fusarium oligoseptatum TaxID=2604345 RepID=A0A428TYA7_9HYPO|nr:hypothetical protein CEP52_005406 [Fusarium oligoseptatum]